MTGYFGNLSDIITNLTYDIDTFKEIGSDYNMTGTAQYKGKEYNVSFFSDEESADRQIAESIMRSIDLERDALLKDFEDMYKLFDDNNVRHLMECIDNNHMTEMSPDELRECNKNFLEAVVCPGYTKEDVIKVFPDAVKYLDEDIPEEEQER